MIIFRWDLSPNQVAVLRQLDERADSEAGALRPPNITNWLGSVRPLLAERLVQCEQVPNDNPKIWSGKTRPRWSVTEKGKLLLRLVALEVQDQAQTLRELKHGTTEPPARRRLRAGV